MTYRRARYACAIAVSVLLFWTLGWKLAAPPADWGGVSLLAWGDSGLVASVGLALLLLGATTVCSLLVHPDSPHMGLFCALIGLAGLSIRGGPVHMLLERVQTGVSASSAQGSAQYLAGYAHTYEALARTLALECAEWALIFLIGEVFARLLHHHFFANTRWIVRTGPDLAADLLGHTRPGAAVLGVSMQVSKALRTNEMRRRVATPLAMIASGAMAFVLLPVLMQSPLKGQVLMACGVAFFGSTLCAYLVFPRVPILALLLTVPLTGAAAYLYGRNILPRYPGQPGSFGLRALPVDYIATGIPGAILGYYAGFRWSLHSHEH